MIHYLDGDATEPVGDGPKIIAHCCNNVGGWGSGFVLALSNKWIAPEMAYRQLCQQAGEHVKALLGSTQIVPVEKNLWVSNIFGQTGVARPGVDKPLVEEALAAGLYATSIFAEQREGSSIHLPRIGCGLAGGSWAVVEKLIETFIDVEVDVYVYDFPGGTPYNP